jgi:CRP/FNR family cyclic AMP-dependent transcriptional regulator
MPAAEALIAALESPVVRDLAARGEARAYPKNAVLLNEQDVGESVYVVLSGRVKVYVSDLDGHEMVIGTCGPGDLLGEMSLDGGPRSASAMTLEPTVCSIVSRTQLAESIARNPDIAFHLIGNLIGRAREAIGHVKGLALLDAYGRIVRLMLAMARPRPGGAAGELFVAERLTQQEFGDRAGTSRDMVGRVLKDLATGGYVTLNDDRTIVIHRRPPPRW